MKFKNLFSFFIFPLILLSKGVYAHCPLCTIGAAAVAGGAAYYGVNQLVIGLFIGGFAISMGMWIARLIKKKYVPFQTILIVLISFFTTILPLLPLMKEVAPLYISLFGGYGTLLNRTYVINLFFIGSIPGGIMVGIAPWLSKKITSLRKGKRMPFQGIMITLLLLIIAGVILQFVF